MNLVKKIVPERITKDQPVDLEMVSGFSVQNTGETLLHLSNASENEKLIDVPAGSIRPFGELLGIPYSGKLYINFKSEQGKRDEALIIKNMLVEKPC